MNRSLRSDEARLWAVVARTVRPSPGRAMPVLDPEPPPAAVQAKGAATPPSRPPAPTTWRGPADIEPGRRRRIARGREPIDARLDLHGLDQDRARQTLGGFLRRAQDEGVRAVLVITGKGLAGEGVLRRRLPEWLADPSLRLVVAGYSHAERHHGGEGALYVALKRKAR